jgi:ParB-like chromosome segregation protein Spo0J
MGALHGAERMPVLRFVPVADLIPHEQADQVRTEPLVQRLRTEGVLKNPPVVAPIPGEPRYVVLDGANRVEAARRLGLPHLVVQVVDYEDPRLVVEAWTHVISGEDPQAFFEAVRGIEGITLEPSERLHAPRGAGPPPGPGLSQLSARGDLSGAGGGGSLPPDGAA